MACKTGGTGLNAVYSRFGENRDRVFIMAYSHEFTGATMTSAYQQLSIDLLFPLVCTDGGSMAIKNELGHPWTAGGWLLHPDGRKEDIAYKEETLTAKLTAVLLDSCATETEIHTDENHEKMQRANISVQGSAGGISLKTSILGEYRITLFTLNGQHLETRVVQITGVESAISFNALPAAGTYALGVSGPAGTASHRLTIQ